MDDDIHDLLEKCCELCMYPRLEKDQEKLICEHCDLCELEAGLYRLAAKAQRQGQVYAAQVIMETPAF